MFDRLWADGSRLTRGLYLLVVAAVMLAGNALIAHLSGTDSTTLLALNTLVTPTWIMKEGLFRLVNNVKFMSNVRRTYDRQYQVGGAKVGYIVNARLPVKYLVTEGDAFQPQGVQEQIVPIALTDLLNVALEFSTGSLTMEVDEYRERYLEPAFDQLGNEVDARGLKRMAQATSKFVGVPNVTPGSTGTLPQASTDAYLDAGVKLDNASVPVDKRIAMLSPAMHRYLVGGTYTLFNPALTIAKNYRTGQFGNDQLGIDEWFKTQNVYRHTIGALGTTPLTNGASQSGSSIITDGWTAVAANRLKLGDKITIAAVNAVNPMTKQSTGQLMQFTVTADVASDGSGNATIPISPAIVGPGSAYQNVDALVADGAAILTFGAVSTYASVITAMGLVYHPDAYTLVTADLVKPEGAWVSERIRSKALGIAFRLWKDGDIRTNEQLCRLDILIGWKAVREELGCVVLG
jgi:hypothetical protein